MHSADLANGVMRGGCMAGSVGACGLWYENIYRCHVFGHMSQYWLYFGHV